jgi:heterogeneous nuclear ribonucleoprotein F/H
MIKFAREQHITRGSKLFVRGVERFHFSFVFVSHTILRPVSPLHPAQCSVLVVMDNGRPSGVAFVEFPTPQEATTALSKNKQNLGSRYVEMFAANRADLERYKSRGGF